MYTMIIADDEENIRHALIKAVDWKALGFNIIGEASNGIEALELVETLEPDLLVSDIKMPFVNGIELVRAARDVRPNLQIVFLSGYDHFEYAKEAIKYNILDYLLKPLSKNDIIREFTNIKTKLDEKFGAILEVSNENSDNVRRLKSLEKNQYFNLLLNHKANEYISKVSFEKIKMEIPVTAKEHDFKYVLCVIKGLDEIKSEEDEIVMKQLYNAVKIVSTKYFPCECFVFANHIIVLGCEKESRLNKYLKFMSKDIVLSTKRVMDIDIRIGVSEFYDALLSSDKAYQHALDAVSYIDDTEEHIIHYDDINCISEENLLEDMLEKYEENLKKGSEVAISKYIDDIFRYINENKLSQNDFQACVLEILFLNVKILKTIDMDSEKATKLINKFVFGKPKVELENEIKKFSMEVVESVSKQRQKSAEVLSRQAIDIIKHEYANPKMSLNMIADQLHVSPNYLSSLIKKTTGESFVSILTATRMEKAKDMLIMTNKKIMEVGEECGYFDQHYFSYCFKKYFNTSPNKIRGK